MATLTTQDITLDGIVPSYASAAGGGDEFVWDKYTFLHVKNGGGSSIDVTIASQASAGQGLAAADKVVAVGAGSEKFIGPFQEAAFEDINGKVQVSYSGVTTVTVAALHT